MGVQASASRSALLLICPRPFDPDTPVEDSTSGEPARYGSAFHQVIATCLRSKKALNPAQYAKAVDAAALRHDVRRSSAELAGHVRSSLKVLQNWLKREGLDEITQVETAAAVRPNADGTWEVRSIPPHDEEHRYDVEADEIPGTVDLVVRTGNRRRTVIIDHKTGSYATDDFARPSKIPQMRTLGLLGNEVGIFHADRLGLPMVYAEPYEIEDQKWHAKILHRALGRVGEGLMRTGPHCARCPAHDSCPAQAADLLSEGTAALVRATNALVVEPIDPQAPLAPPLNGSTVETRAAALYDLLKRFRALEKAGSEEIRRLVRAGRLIETRNGVLTLQEQTYETLSKKSVIDALGKVAGEKELKRLREKGAVREASREQLVAEPDKVR